MENLKTFWQKSRPHNSAQGGILHKSWRYFNWSLKAAFITLLLTVFQLNSAEASHFRYGDISWRVVESDPTGRTIEFKVNTGWRLNAVNTIYLRFGDGTGAYMSRVITNVNGEYSYSTGTVRHTYASNGNYTAFYSGCCKISNLANNRDDSWYMRTVVNVGTGNNSPVTTVPAIVNLQTNQSQAKFFIPATDPDGDNLSFALASTAHGWPSGSTHPSGISVNSSTGEVTFNTNGRGIGTLWNTAVAISDGKTTVIVDYIIKITQVSTPPQFDYSSTPANGFVYNASPGQTISFPINAYDTDPGSNVRINGIGIPSGASVRPGFGTVGNPIQNNFSWTPTASQFGTFVMNFIAQDNNGVQAQTSVSIIVSLKPVFDVPPTPPEAVHNILTPGVPFNYAVQASDPDPDDVVQIIAAEGKAMNGSKIPLYAGASFSPLPTASGNPTSGTFSWTPQVSDWGHKHVFFTAEDSYGDRAIHEVASLVNSLPVFSPQGNEEAIVGIPFQMSISATDADIPYGDALALIASALPGWLNLQDHGNGTATLSGTPSIGDVGINNVEIMAEDIHHHHYVNQVPVLRFDIEVTNCKVYPICKNFTLELDAQGQGLLLASDIDNGSSVTCGPMQLALSRLQFDCNDIGSHSVTLYVMDNSGNIDSCQASVDVVDAVAPIAQAQDLVIALDENGEATISAADVDNGSSDNCAIASLSINQSNFDCSHLGDNAVTLTVTDPYGNGNAPLPPGIIGHWKFEGANPRADFIGNWGDLELYRNASIANGQLDVNAGSLVRSTSYSGPAISSKTLISFAKIQNLDLRSGSILTLDGISNDNFDAIVYAERQPRRWMSGSSYFRRTQDPVPGFAESVANQTVMMAITYQHLGGGLIRIIIYRNGQVIGSYDSGNASSWSPSNVEVLFGCRHSYGNSPVGQLDALIDEAMIYGRALSAAEIQGIYDGFNSGGGSSTVANVQVIDTIAPSITCPADINIVAQRDDCDPQVFWDEPIASDNCSVSVLASHASGDEFPVGSTTVTYTATDQSGNSTSCSFVVTVSPEPLVLSSSVLSEYLGGYNISCKGASDGSIDIEIEGGCLPYSYAWSNGATSEDLAGLLAGNYAVTISDANGSSISASFDLLEPEALALEVSDNSTVYLGYDPAACADIGLSISGGVAPYSYEWSNGFSGTSQEVCPSESTEYSVTVTDANGCQISDAIMVCVIDIRSRDRNGNIKKGKVDICHIPPGNPANARTISISVNAVADHIANHGDQLGACGANPTCLDDGLEEPYQGTVADASDDEDSGSSGKGKGRGGKKSNVDNHNHVFEAFEARISPNPFADFINIQISHMLSPELELQLVDLTGKKILYKQYNLDSSQDQIINLSTNNLAVGVYLLHVRNGQEQSVTRIVKQ